VTDREVVPGCTRVRRKCAEKTSVGLWGQSIDPRELLGVTGPGHRVVGVLQATLAGGGSSRRRRRQSLAKSPRDPIAFILYGRDLIALYFAFRGFFVNFRPP
jgi:hypothetical protein